jgi:hypothetical protein
MTVVIDPNGISKGLPSVGYGFRQAAKHIGIPHDQLSKWVVKSEELEHLKLPSGKLFRVVKLLAEDGQNYSVIEATDWLDIVEDLIINPGQSKKIQNSRNKLAAFLKWFAIEGFYPSVWTELFGQYTKRMKDKLQIWILARETGKTARNEYTELLQELGVWRYEKGVRGYKGSYQFWTNLIYQGLFEGDAVRLKELHQLVKGDKSIARNYIAQTEGLEAVAFCESLVVTLYSEGDKLREVHDLAIERTKRKFKLGFQIVTN